MDNNDDLFANFLNRMDTFEEDPLTRKEEFSMGVFDKFLFDQQIQQIDQMSDQEAYIFIKENLEYITSRILNKQWEYPHILIREKYLRAFSKVLATMPVSASVRTCTNKICYDYLTSGLDDPNVKKVVLDLSRTVNYNQIQALIGVGIPSEIASILTLSRYSTINEEVNIKRLNFCICQQDPELMTVQNIVYIYEKLFDRIGELFKQTMFEYYTPEQELDLGSSFQEVYSTVSLAVLTIVNNMTISNIEKLIRGYIADWEYSGRPPVRFSLISLSADYSRIQRIVEVINAEGTFVP